MLDASKLHSNETHEDLDEALSQYREVTRGRMEGLPAKAAGGFATAAGAAVALAGGAEAAIVYSGPQNFGISVDSLIPPPGYGTSFFTSNTVEIDVDGDGTGDFTFALNAQRMTLSSSSMTSQAGAAIIPDGDADFVVNGSLNGPKDFSSGETIGASQVFAFGTYNLAYGSNVVLSGSSVMGTWTGSRYGIIGVRLEKPGGNTHYGWIRLFTDDTANPQDPNGPGEGIPDDIAIVDWAYEDSPNTPIAAGAIPEPSGLSLFAAGAASLPYWRRRKEKRDAKRAARASAE